ncbi:MAG TPA: hypothetical protein VI757_12335 [Bacteroidia bacterium]|nr:hypothetical protein [Bacteroidia bacterium]
MTIQYLTKGKKKGVFLSLRDWNSVKKELQELQAQLSSIETRRKEILLHFSMSKKEVHRFSSRISDLKSMLK